jgi:hypothetical protein
MVKRGKCDVIARSASDEAIQFLAKPDSILNLYFQEDWIASRFGFASRSQ